MYIGTIVHKGGIPDLDGYRKDHKVFNNVILGPPCRPVCNAKLGPNAPFANILSRFLRPVREGVQQSLKTEVLSTEEV